MPIKEAFNFLSFRTEGRNLHQIITSLSFILKKILRLRSGRQGVHLARLNARKTAIMVTARKVSTQVGRPEQTRGAIGLFLIFWFFLIKQKER